MVSRLTILAGALTGALAFPSFGGPTTRTDLEDPVVTILTFSYDAAGNRVFRSAMPDVNTVFPGIDPGVQPEPGPGEQPEPRPDPDPGELPVDPGEEEIPEVPGN